MRDGFVKVGAANIQVRVCDVAANAEAIIDEAGKLSELGVKVIVFSELCVTGKTCRDYFYQDALINEALKGVMHIAQNTAKLDSIIFIGAPLVKDGRLYNCGIAINQGRILGIIPKVNLSKEDMRYFSDVYDDVTGLVIDGEAVPFDTNLLFTCSEMQGLKIGVEIGEDLFAGNAQSVYHFNGGATLCVNLSGLPTVTGSVRKIKSNIEYATGKFLGGYVFANAGTGESSTDNAYGGEALIFENGKCIKENASFAEESIFTEIDIESVVCGRRRLGYAAGMFNGSYQETEFVVAKEDTMLTRKFPVNPFVPADIDKRNERCQEILNIQIAGLSKRVKATSCKSLVLGISGGLDSTLALIVCAESFKRLGIDTKNILAVTMPCFGTSKRTYDNAVKLAELFNVTFKEVSIKDAVLQHFKDINQDPEKTDTTFENAQARERTQVLMDLANQTGGMVVGTGDMSELALGWATYNGDHMSMYGVNASVCKTLVRQIVRWYGESNGDMADTLFDIIDTPVSPELLPPKEGEIAQKTEDLVGPYELHDFFMYYILQYGFAPKKIYRMALNAFDTVYDKETVLKWLKVFYRRFVSMQFKRSCSPDGAAVGSISLSPRTGLFAPSDAVSAVWLKELEEIN